MAPVLYGLVPLAYLLGTFPTAQLVGRRHGFDPTTAGSGNPGASNTTRIGGARAGALVLGGDLCKGAIAAGIGLALGGGLPAWAFGAAAVAGHVWPVTRSFRGGKGVATALGVGLVAEPVLALVASALFALVVARTRTAALGSLLAVGVIPPAMIGLGRPWAESACATVVVVAIVVRHRENIARLRSGTEHAVKGDEPTR